MLRVDRHGVETCVREDLGDVGRLHRDPGVDRGAAGPDGVIDPVRPEHRWSSRGGGAGSAAPQRDLDRGAATRPRSILQVVTVGYPACVGVRGGL
ncbi:hypothetical protein SDC9_77238 [bioreactor metagenome]|uniref:Uncharacterized protein n=1 Tax=bioreactor metagenome TaxID=1076179 RepID=A0A644YRT8_9ZZZZ